MLTKNDRLLNMLRLARKAGKLVVGVNACLVQVQRYPATMLMLATDLSVGSRKRLLQDAPSARVYTYGDKDFYGDVTGRATVGVVCITDKNFADGVVKILES